MRNHLKINDFTAIQTDFDKFAEEIKQNGDLLFGGDTKSLTANIIRNFAYIENAINDIQPEVKSKMNKNNSQSYTKLKQKFRKYLQTTGPDNNNYEQ